MSNMRIGGLASGLDINQIVKDLMRVERMPLQKLEQQKTLLEWKRDDYRAINTLLLDFRSLLTQMKLTTQYRVRTASSTNEAFISATATSAAAQASYTISKVSQLAAAETQVNGGSIAGVSFSAARSLYEQRELMHASDADVWKNGFIQSRQTVVKEKTNAIDLELADIKEEALQDWTVTVNGIGYKIVTGEISPDQLEEGQAWYNDGKLYFGNEIDKNSIVRVGYVTNTKTERLTIGKDSQEWNLSYKNLSALTLNLIIDGESEALEIVPDPEEEGTGLIRRQDDGTVIGTVDYASGKIEFNDNMPRPDEDSDKKIVLEATFNSDDAVYTTMSLKTHTSNGEMYNAFLIDGRDSLTSVINRVNESKLGVMMFYDDVTRQITLTRTETGQFNAGGTEIEFPEEDNDFLLRILRFGDDTARVTEHAKDAVFTMNGLETSRKSNSFQINGVTFTLKQIFDAETDASVAPVTVHITNNSEQVYENIKNFVDKYNELIDKIREKTEEERYRNYLPLTDEEREQLTEKQQEQWEEKARSGLLRRDPLLLSLLTEMRMDFSRPVNHDDVSPLFNQMAQIGIETTPNYLEGGKLVINEAKLKQAIEEDPVSVENFFRGDGVDDSGRGVIHRLYDTVNKAMDLIKERAGSAFSVNHQFTIGREIMDIEDRIDRFEERLIKIEDRYWRQFTAMEKAIQRANTQMGYLWQQFGGY